MANAREIHQARLDHWIGFPQKNHVRVLLCTLPDILGPDSGIERVGMDKLMEPSSVRKAYIKYIRNFHPDKVGQTKDLEKIYIATTVFAAVNVQYELFKKEAGLK